MANLYFYQKRFKAAGLPLDQCNRNEMGYTLFPSEIWHLKLNFEVLLDYQRDFDLLCTSKCYGN